ncbi:MAG: hypothetical protein KAQ92_06895 [Candidatus Aenigmarchaeota archaeon]|nr:hypothetical protein [Candidatus Aenigmarchaeota archaeon]
MRTHILIILIIVLMVISCGCGSKYRTLDEYNSGNDEKIDSLEKCIKQCKLVFLDYRHESIYNEDTKKCICNRSVNSESNSSIILECEKKGIANKITFCYTQKAIETKNVNVCELIEPISHYDDCIIAVALSKRDISICKLSKIKTNRDACTKTVTQFLRYPR